jgi:hypothetical protein
MGEFIGFLRHHCPSMSRRRSDAEIDGLGAASGMPAFAKACISGAAVLCAALFSSAVLAQSAGGTQLIGTYDNGEPFKCSLVGTTCTQLFNVNAPIPICNTTLIYSGTAVYTGLNLAQPGPLAGTDTVDYPEFLPIISADGTTCTGFTFTGLRSQESYPFSGTWNGTTGSFKVALPIVSGTDYSFSVSFKIDNPPPPVFPMVVSGSITSTVANITADIQFRPQDVGTAGSVYVFALAPATLVKNAVVTGKHLGPVTNATAKDAPLPCVLAQLTSSGQLTAASSSSLQTYLTGVLSSQGASIGVLNGVSTALIQGSVFYVGYGPNSTAMINNGINRSAVTVPGPQVCQPQAPQTGWWWNKNEGGRGFSIETQGDHLFMAGYLYDSSGRATWMTSGGLTSLDGSFYNSTLLSYANGQTLAGPYQKPSDPTFPGSITLTFTDARNGTLIWPGGAVPIERFDSQLPPSTSPQPAFAPENGWWWNASENGRGYFLEFRNSFAFIAGYMYDASGNPLWYLSSGTMPVQQTFQGNWSQWANGQTMTGAYKPATQINGNVGALSIQFQDTMNATMTLPDGRRLPITRFKF